MPTPSNVVPFVKDEVVVSDRMKDALKELMAAECEMMASLYPDFASHFTWGRVRVGDLALSNRFSFEFGGADDHPGGPDFDVT